VLVEEASAQQKLERVQSLKYRAEGIRIGKIEGKDLDLGGTITRMKGKDPPASAQGALSGTRKKKNIDFRKKKTFSEVPAAGSGNLKLAGAGNHVGRKGSPIFGDREQETKKFGIDNNRRQAAVKEKVPISPNTTREIWRDRGTEALYGSCYRRPKWGGAFYGAKKTNPARRSGPKPRGGRRFSKVLKRSQKKVAVSHINSWEIERARRGQAATKGNVDQVRWNNPGPLRLKTQGKISSGENPQNICVFYGKAGSTYHRGKSSFPDLKDCHRPKTRCQRKRGKSSTELFEKGGRKANSRGGILARKAE